jgi:hypothetical protein
MKQRKPNKRRKPKAPEGPFHTDTSLGATNLAWRAGERFSETHSGKTEPIPVPPQPQPIIPTVYPAEPDGAVTVYNQITINIQSTDFRKFETTLDELLEAMRRSNEIAGEVRDQLTAEITAGRTLLKAPKADRNWIDLLLLRPLKYIAEKGGSAVIGKLATAALDWLFKLLG